MPATATPPIAAGPEAPPAAGGRRAGRGDLLLVAAVAALLYLPWLGARDLWRPNEPIYGQATREMEVRGAWLMPTVGGEAFAEKPLLFFWLARLASFATGGVNELSLRLGPACAGILAVVLAYLLALPYGGRRYAATVALLLATTSSLYYAARRAEMDAFVLCAALAILVPLTRAADFAAPATASWALAGLGAGLGFLAKGPVSLVVPGLTIAAYAAITRRPAMLSPKHLLAAAFSAMAIIVPWIGITLAAGHGEALREMFLRQNVTRFVAAWDHQEGPAYYLIAFWGVMAPWALLVPLAVRAPSPDRRLRLLAWCCLAATLLFFSLSTSKRGPYIIPAAPAVAVLAADVLLASGAKPRREQRAVLAVLALVALLLGSAGVLLIAAGAAIVHDLALELRVIGAVLAASAAVIVAGLRHVGQQGKPAHAYPIAAMFLVYLAASHLLPSGDAVMSSRPLCEDVLRLAPAGAPLATFPDSVRAAELMFYLRRDLEVIHWHKDVAGYLRRRNAILVIEDRHLPYFPDLSGARCIAHHKVGSRLFHVLQGGLKAQSPPVHDP